MGRYWRPSLPIEDDRPSTHIAPKPGKQPDTLFQSVEPQNNERPGSPAARRGDGYSLCLFLSSAIRSKMNVCA
jgi:hypothetical protein